MSYLVIANCEVESALSRIKNLFADEEVRFEQIGAMLRSTSTPIVALSIQPILYSRRNWVGLNPFVFISGITVAIQAQTGKSTVVEISINRLRAYVLALLWTTLGCVVGWSLPWPAGALLFIGVAFSGWFGIVVFFGSYLVKGEITDALSCA